MYAKPTSWKAIRPSPGGRTLAPGASRTSSVSSTTSKIRSPDAVARWACPIHMPSIRSGMTSIRTRTLKAKNEFRASSPLATIRPPYSSTVAWAMSGRNESSGT